MAHAATDKLKLPARYRRCESRSGAICARRNGYPQTSKPVSPRDVERRDSEEERVRKAAKRKMISAELEDFLRYLNSPWHIVWRNLLVGLARGLGAIFGATVVVGLAIWVLKIFIDLPLVGEYAREFQAKVHEVAEETRYTDDFARIQSTLERIDKRLKEQNELLKAAADERSQ